MKETPASLTTLSPISLPVPGGPRASRLWETAPTLPRLPEVRQKSTTSLELELGTCGPRRRRRARLRLHLDLALGLEHAHGPAEAAHAAHAAHTAAPSAEEEEASEQDQGEEEAAAISEGAVALGGLDRKVHFWPVVASRVRAPPSGGFSERLAPSTPASILSRREDGARRPLPTTSRNSRQPGPFGGEGPFGSEGRRRRLARKQGGPACSWHRAARGPLARAAAAGRRGSCIEKAATSLPRGAQPARERVVFGMLVCVVRGAVCKIFVRVGARRYGSTLHSASCAGGAYVLQ